MGSPQIAGAGRGELPQAVGCNREPQTSISSRVLDIGKFANNTFLDDLLESLPFSLGAMDVLWEHILSPPQARSKSEYRLGLR